MRFKYCPNCAGVSTMQEKGGLYKCWRCNFVGKPSEGTADEINTLMRRLKSGLSQPRSQGIVPDAGGSAPTGAGAAGSGTGSSGAGFVSRAEQDRLRERLRQLNGKKSDDFEFL
ncbi:MAG: hypothetical protein NTW59_03295 [Candidatus Diapherotrites archaeon]|nr:hypothetical protein [Candidatus Diapherotrites archaeon]